jgi:type II secretory pathway component PulF
MKPGGICFPQARAVGYNSGMLKEMFEPRIGLKPLVGLCRSLGTSLGAGIDIRNVLAREADRAHGHLRRCLLEASQAVHQGAAFSDALEPSGDFFPPIFREMCKVGEETGQMDLVFIQLADHYQTQLDMRRSFLSAIAGPVIQLVLSAFIVGLAIWIMGMLGKDIDLYGFGLIGNRGLAIYVNFWAIVIVVGWIVIRAARRGVVWTRPIQKLALRLPGLGKPLQIMALSRLAWSMHLTMNTGMDVRRALKLSLRSTQNARYIDQIPEIDESIKAGNSIDASFRFAGGYPVEFLDTLAVGEESGQVVESMGRLAKLYEEQARMAMKTIAMIASWVVWAIIAGLIIFLIFRVFTRAYLGVINNALGK